MRTCEPEIDLSDLKAEDLPAARALVREAFATVIGEAEPGEFWNQRDYVSARWHAPHTHWFKAHIPGTLLGVACVSRWGRHAVVGPVAVAPDHWEQDIAKQLMAHVSALIDEWGCTHSGLFTFPDSPRHLGLYQQFGFWPRCLSVVVARPLSGSYSPLVEQHSGDLHALQSHCRSITEAISPGLEVSGEIEAALRQGLGDVVTHPDGFAICHYGQHCEAGPEVCYVRFAAVRPGAGPEGLARLIEQCEALAAAQQARQLLVGVNTGRVQAYRWLLEAGFRMRIIGVTLHKGQDYDNEAVLLLDDWR